MIHRRSFITGLVSLVAAPAIVRVGSIMPVRVMEPFVGRFEPLPFEDLSPAAFALPDLISIQRMTVEMARAMYVPGHYLAPTAQKLLTLTDSRWAH